MAIKIFFLLTIACVLTSICGLPGSEPDSQRFKRHPAANCPPPACSTITDREVLVRLWMIPRMLNALQTDLRDKILAFMNASLQSNRRLFAVVLAQTLWAVDRLTGFSPSPSPSCVFNTLVAETVAVRNGADSKNLDKAADSYGELAGESFYFSIGRTLGLTGCSSDPFKYKAESATQCPLSAGLPTQLNAPESSGLIGAALVTAIDNLRLSAVVDDQVIAAGAIAATTPASVAIFETLISNNNFNKFIRLMACSTTDRVTSECCRERRDLLISLAKDAARQARAAGESFIRKSITLQRT